MEPFISREGSTLSFNDSNDPGNDPDIPYTTHVDDTLSAFTGRVAGLATPALEGTPTMNRDARLSALSADRLTLRFARGRSAPQIWRARRAGASSLFEAPALSVGKARLSFQRPEGVGCRIFIVPKPAP